MTDRRFYVEKEINDQVVIDGDEFNHLRNVLRLKVGDQVIVVCGDGNDYYGQICEMTKSLATVNITEVVKNDKDAVLDVTVYLGLVKNDSFSSIITKLSELGVHRIVPFTSDYAQGKASDVKLDKLQKVANMAIKQCDRSIPLKVDGVISFDAMLLDLKNYDQVYFTYEKEEGKDVDLKPTGKKIAVVVGSIGGFSEKEIQKAKDCHIQVVSLGKRILRVETACVAVVSVLMYESGEWNIE